MPDIPVTEPGSILHAAPTTRDRENPLPSSRLLPPGSPLLSRQLLILPAFGEKRLAGGN